MRGERRAGPSDPESVQSFLLESIRRALAGVDPKQTEQLVARILSSKRIFLYGAGRSGFVARSFTMRLKHLGMPIVRMSIDPTTPPTAEDSAVIISGTGETPSSVDYANLAVGGGAAVFAITHARDSALGRIGAHIILLEQQASDEQAKAAPLGTVFEEAALVYLDSLVAVLMDRLGQNEGDLRRRHGVTR